MRDRLGALLLSATHSLLPPAAPLTECGRRVIHFHIQKTGGTSVNWAFYSLAYSNRILTIAKLLRLDNKLGDLNRIHQGQLCYMVSNRTTGFVRSRTTGYCITRDSRLIRNDRASYIHSHNPDIDLLNHPKLLSLTVLRDPVERLLSRYRMDVSLWRHDALAHYGRSYTEEQISSPWKYFAELKRQAPHDYFGLLSTFSPNLNLNEGRSNLGKVNVVMRQDHLQQDFATMNRAYGLPIDPQFIVLGNAKSNPASRFREAPVTDNLVDSLSDSLRVEYRLIEGYL